METQDHDQPDDGDKVVNPEVNKAIPAGEDTNNSISDLYKDGKELEQSPTRDGSKPDTATDAKALSDGMSGLPGGAALGTLLGIAPFTNLMQQKADRMYSHETPQGRMNKYVRAHPRVDTFSMIADILTRIIVVLLIITAVVLIGWNTLLPLPDLTAIQPS